MRNFDNVVFFKFNIGQKVRRPNDSRIFVVKGRAEADSSAFGEIRRMGRTGILKEYLITEDDSMKNIYAHFEDELEEVL